jgi:hypothetical protein
MDLIQYLSQTKKKESKKKGKKKLDKRPKIPRRARGYGQRHSKYNSNTNFRDNIDKQLLALLTTLTKQNQPKIDLSNPQALNPFIEKERQTYSMSFEPKVKTLEERLSKVEKKAITMGEIGIDPEKQAEEDMKKYQDEIDISIINNEFEDYKGKWNEVIDNQESLNQSLYDIGNQDLSEKLQEEFRLENIKLKDDILSLQSKLQEDLNETKDLNRYQKFIDLQKTVLSKSIDNFVSVDNRLAQELVKDKEKLGEEKEGFEKLQEQTFNEKREIQKQNDLLNIELQTSQVKEQALMEELNSLTDQFATLQEKVFKMETNPELATSPERVEVEPLPELPKPKPTAEELEARKQKKEDMRIGKEQREREEKRKEQIKKNNISQLKTMVDKNSVFSPKLKKIFVEEFGEKELDKINLISKRAPPKLRMIKQLLIERGVEF